MDGKPKLSSFIFWVSWNLLLCTLGTTTTEANDLWCLWCRSDRDNACINNIRNNEHKFTRPCNNDTLVAFYQDLKSNPPKRPVINVRSTNGLGQSWGCYRVYTLDQTFTFRSCQKTDYGGRKESCDNCKFDGVKARCCICNTPNCNSKNSNATRTVFEQPIIILTFVIVCISLIFI